MGHTHAAAMAEYAKDALEIDKPWERWEFSKTGRDYDSLHEHPSWNPDIKYRRKPKVILINGYEVPEPCREPLHSGQKFWIVNPFKGPQWFTWDGSEEDFHALKNGFVLLTEEAAEKHFNARKIFTVKGDQ